jgi:hypothetical protein
LTALGRKPQFSIIVLNPCSEYYTTFSHAGTKLSGKHSTEMDCD